MTTKKSTAARPAPRLKNYTSEASEASIFGAIQRCLAQHNVKRVMIDNDSQGRAVAIEFILEVQGHALHYRLPARIENVTRLVRQSLAGAHRSMSDERVAEQAYRTAWANIRDWIEAQMALVDAEMVQVAEVFLPYLVNQNGMTYFEDFEQRLALPPPRADNKKRGDNFTITEIQNE